MGINPQTHTLAHASPMRTLSHAPPMYVHPMCAPHACTPHTPLCIHPLTHALVCAPNTCALACAPVHVQPCACTPPHILVHAPPFTPLCLYPHACPSVCTPMHSLADALPSMPLCMHPPHAPLHVPQHMPLHMHPPCMPLCVQPQHMPLQVHPRCMPLCVHPQMPLNFYLPHMYMPHTHPNVYPTCTPCTCPMHVLPFHDWLRLPTTTRLLAFKNLINIKSWFFPHYLFEKVLRTARIDQLADSNEPAIKLQCIQVITWSVWKSVSLRSCCGPYWMSKTLSSWSSLGWSLKPSYDSVVMWKFMSWHGLCGSRRSSAKNVLCEEAWQHS